MFATHHPAIKKLNWCISNMRLISFVTARLRLKSLLGDRNGNVALVVAIVAVPMLLAVGASLDYTRAYNVQNKMQADLDAALVAAIKQIDTNDESKLEQKIGDWFEAQADKRDSSYDLTEIRVDKLGHTITATAKGTVPTTLMTLANIKTVPVGVTSAIKGPATSYVDVYVVVDKSPSMLLAATTEGQSLMRNTANCEFACHSTADPVTVQGTSYPTYYAYSKAAGVKLRADVALDAVGEVLDMIDKADKDHARIKVGLYRLGDTISQELPPTYSTSAARKKLADDSSGLTSASSMKATYFQTALKALKTKIGTAGDGMSAASPLKLVLLLTDGVQSDRSWVTTGRSKTCVTKVGKNCVRYKSGALWGQVTPLNPDWCAYLKENKASVAVLYTEYLAIPLDWGYNGTVGDTMKSSSWTSTWGGTLHSGVSANTSRQDYIPIALQDCASSPDLFISASSENEITKGLSSLFTQYLTSVRLTQ
jgi:Flp pilus assembly protein TadG